MNPVELIKQDLGEETWSKMPQFCGNDELKPYEPLSPFDDPKVYIVGGRTGQFEFTSLPHGSYCFYLANGKFAVRITREGRELESALKQNWAKLDECDPIKLAKLILKFYDGGTKWSNNVVPNAESILTYGKNFSVDQKVWSKIQDRIGETSIVRHPDEVVIRAVTLWGWMHEKKTLTIERIHIAETGEVNLEKCELLTHKLFKSVPFIMY